MESSTIQVHSQINPNEPSPQDVFSDPDVSSLLSILASEQPRPFPPDVADKQPSYPTGSSHVSVETPASLQVAQATPFGPPEPVTQPRRAPRRERKSGMKVQSQKKRGRPRKDGDNPMEPQEERRRKQIRVAQRAYREREKTALSQNQARVTQLETSVEKMSTLISSFGEDLIESGVLVPHTDIQDRLLNTILMCKSLAEDAGLSPQEESYSPLPNNEESLSMSIQPTRSDPERRLIDQLQGDSASPSFIPSPVTTSSLHTSPEPLGHNSPLLFDTAASTMSPVDLPTFIRQLRMACAYHALFSLRNSSVELDGLRRKFRFLLSILPRESLISYFEAGLIARIHPERMLEWEKLPFFQVGGAGTHFPRLSYPQPKRPYPIQNDPLAAFSPDVQDEMDGRWYDASDLEGLLEERGVRFLTKPPTEAQLNETGWITVDPSKLIKVLVTRSICLGRSPGWRPLQVEQALQMSIWDKEKSTSIV